MASFAIFQLVAAILWAQQPPAPPMPPKPPRPLAAQLADIRKRLHEMKPVNATALRALQFSREFSDSADQAFRSGERFVADRLAAASEELLHVAEHQRHLGSGAGPKVPPPPEQIQDHLQRVYFRVEQADYFFKQAHDSRVASFPGWARDLYQSALRAYDHRNFIAADENAKSAEDIVMALENVAQAAAPAKMPPPPPPPLRPPL